MGQYGEHEDGIDLNEKIDCPKCTTTMQQIMISKSTVMITVDRCNHCEGYWFDSFELDKVLDEETKRDGLPFNSSDEHEAHFNCPRCAGSCETRTLYDIRVDFCNGCGGIWLDKGELAGIQRAYRIEQNQNKLLELLQEAMEA